MFVDYAGDTVPVIVDRVAAAVGAARLEPGSPRPNPEAHRSIRGVPRVSAAKCPATTPASADSRHSLRSLTMVAVLCSGDLVGLFARSRGGGGVVTRSIFGGQRLRCGRWGGDYLGYGRKF